VTAGLLLLLLPLLSLLLGLLGGLLVSFTDLFFGEHGDGTGELVGLGGGLLLWHLGWIFEVVGDLSGKVGSDVLDLLGVWELLGRAGDSELEEWDHFGLPELWLLVLVLLLVLGGGPHLTLVTPLGGGGVALFGRVILLLAVTVATLLGFLPAGVPPAVGSMLLLGLATVLVGGTLAGGVLVATAVLVFIIILILLAAGGTGVTARVGRLGGEWRSGSHTGWAVGIGFWVWVLKGQLGQLDGVLWSGDWAGDLLDILEGQVEGGTGLEVFVLFVSEWGHVDNFLGLDALDNVVAAALATHGVDGLFGASPVLSVTSGSWGSAGLGWGGEVEGWLVVAVGEVGGGNNFEVLVSWAGFWDWDLGWIFLDHVGWEGRDVVQGFAFTVDGILHGAVDDALVLGSKTGEGVGVGGGLLDGVGLLDVHLQGRGQSLLDVGGFWGQLTGYQDVLDGTLLHMHEERLLNSAGVGLLELLGVGVIRQPTLRQLLVDLLNANVLRLDDEGVWVADLNAELWDGEFNTGVLVAFAFDADHGTGLNLVHILVTWLPATAGGSHGRQSGENEESDLHV